MKQGAIPHSEKPHGDREQRKRNRSGRKRPYARKAQTCEISAQLIGQDFADGPEETAAQNHHRSDVARLHLGELILIVKED